MRKMPRQRPKQTNKNELWDEVEEVLEGYVIKRPLDTSNTSFGQDDTIPIKQEIKNEPLDEDSVDIENLSFEKDPMIIDDGQNDPTKMIADQRKTEKTSSVTNVGSLLSLNLNLAVILMVFMKSKEITNVKNVANLFMKKETLSYI